MPENDLFFSIEDRHAWGSYPPVTCGEFEGIAYEYVLEGTEWRRWFLRNGSTLLYATYNGTPEAAVQERSEVEVVLSTARIEVSQLQCQVLKLLLTWPNMAVKGTRRTQALYQGLWFIRVRRLR